MRVGAFVRVVVLVSVSCAVASSSWGAAPTCDDPSAAAKLKKEGNAAFGAGRFADAADAYGRAYACDYDASLLFNLAKADLHLGKYLDGIEAIRRFENETPNLASEVRAAADDMKAKLLAHVGTLSIKASVQGARVTVGDREIGEAPVDNVEIEAGSVVIKVTAPGRKPEERKVDVEGGKHGDVEVSFGPPADAKRDAAPAKPAQVLVISPLVWIGVATVGAGLIVGTATGAESLKETNEIKKSCPQDLCPASTADQRSKATTLANVSNASFAVAGAGAVLGIVGVALSGHRDARTVSVHVSPSSLLVRGTF